MGLWSFLFDRERASKPRPGAPADVAESRRIVRLQGSERFGIKVVGTSRYQDRLSALVGAARPRAPTTIARRDSSRSRTIRGTSTGCAWP